MTPLHLRISVLLPIHLAHLEMEQLELDITGDDRARVVLYAEDATPGVSNSGQPKLDISSTHDVPQPWVEILQQIELRNWPAGFDPNTPNSHLFDFYPPEMQEFCASTTEGLKRHMREFFGMMRWRLHSDVPAGAYITPRLVEWSDDESTWHVLRLPLKVTFGVLPQVRLNPETQDKLHKMLFAQAQEPLGRDIWHAAVNADPRTSIILAVTAVEVEIKRLISEVVPKSEWLIANLPSPPIVKLIKKYLPTIIEIPSNHLPPRPLMATLEQAVTLRNSFVHGGFSTSGGWTSNSDLSPEEVEKYLEASSDLLWLFDLYRGHDWVISYLSEPTKLAVVGKSAE